MKATIREFQNRRFLLFEPESKAEAALLDTLGDEDARIEGFVRFSDTFDIYLRFEITGAPPMGIKTEKCKGCPAQVWKAKSASTGKVAPIHTQPAPDGNIFFLASGEYAVLTGDQLVAAQKSAAEGKTRLFKNHFMNCPNADKFKPSK